MHKRLVGAFNAQRQFLDRKSSALGFHARKIVQNIIPELSKCPSDPFFFHLPTASRPRKIHALKRNRVVIMRLAHCHWRADVRPVRRQEVDLRPMRLHQSGQPRPHPTFPPRGQLTGSSIGVASTRSPLARTATWGAATVESGSTGMRIQATGSLGGSIGGMKAKSMVLSSPVAGRAAVAWNCRGRAAPGPAGGDGAAAAARTGAMWARWEGRRRAVVRRRRAMGVRAAAGMAGLSVGVGFAESGGELMRARGGDVGRSRVGEARKRVLICRRPHF
jgi:hypothetical protein